VRRELTALQSVFTAEEAKLFPTQFQKRIVAAVCARTAGYVVCAAMVATSKIRHSIETIFGMHYK
jgi:hypothetical protein